MGLGVSGTRRRSRACTRPRHKRQLGATPGAPLMARMSLAPEPGARTVPSASRTAPIAVRLVVEPHGGERGKGRSRAVAPTRRDAAVGQRGTHGNHYRRAGSLGARVHR